MIALRPTQDWTDSAPASAEIALSRNGMHVGVVYRRPSGELRVLHLAFHELLRDDASEKWDGASVVATIDPVHLETVAHYAEMVSRRPPNTIPYAFRYETGRLDEGGVYLRGADHGLTCATFVLAVFRAAIGIELLDRQQWPERPGDREAQYRLIAQLEEWHRRGHASAEHVRIVKSELGCPRYRPEEVAAASALEPRPVAIERAEPAGVEVLGLLRALLA